MSAVGLIVAGGAGERMRRSGGTVAKPLVQVAGATLLEHNVRSLLGAGIERITIAVSPLGPGVAEHAQRVIEPLVARHGASLEVIHEDPPLGSLGAAALLPRDHEVLVLNADNVTQLDLQLLLAAHRDSGAAMTLAVHDEPFAMPFGEITVEDGRVVAYREKPTYHITICSAVTVLGPAALERMTPGDHVMLPAFARRLLEEGVPIHAHHHDAAWADVNDLTVLDRAQAVLDAAAPTTGTTP
jgi:NDP-sugar pyrophosphorylase family protein